ncbi:hypothetical protein EO244_04500 [Ancylomarina salipaludis]|uniref:Alginate export domain-containing protein n=1 Tax=Ancylomarina salipaludis TaxID=2501299 RepID=A0A4Q1JPF2_9BACT|nr:hypothetical protein [Ancylomarina salipaludis]RXQ96110.1 hypothetical protein EO244_04500 [Ancylomarina salipaludis]
MRKITLAILAITLSVLLLPQTVKSQVNFEFESSFENINQIDSVSLFSAAFGYARIGEKNYAGVRLNPELRLGKLGVGFDIPVYFNLDNGKMYTDEFKDGSGVLRMISYLSYGRKKKDPLYIKVGQLRGEHVGYGSLVNNYNNSMSFEKRKTGVSYDICIKKIVGIEGMYSDFDASSFNLFAIRPYVRPFGASEIPVIKTLDMGFTYVSDKDKSKRYDESHDINHFLKDGMNAWSVDMGITLVNSSVFNLGWYAHYSKLRKVESDSLKTYFAAPETLANYDSGTGMGIGLNANMKIIGNLFKLNARIERLWYSDNYMPQFFDAMYELNKDAKIAQLGRAEKQEGIYGSLNASILDKIIIGGNLLLPDDINETSPAFMQIHLRTKDLFDKILIEGSYSKGNLTKLDDAFKFDENSLAVMRFAYKISPFLYTGVDYRWAWVEKEDGNYKIDNSVMPYVALRFNF